MINSIWKEIFSNERNLIKMGLDLLAVVVAFFLALYFRFENEALFHFKGGYIIAYSCVYIIAYIYYRIYNKSWSYINSIDILKIILANSISLIGILIYFGLARSGYSRSVIFMLFIFSTIIQLASRLPFRILRSYSFYFKKNKLKRQKAVVYGAGEAGVSLVKESMTNENFPYDIVALLDDDKKKIGTYISGIKVVGSIDECSEILKKIEPEIFIVAMVNIKKSKLKKIIQLIKNDHEDNIKIKILPRMDEILEDNDLGDQVRDIKIEDLLGREQILVNGDNISELICDKVVMVSGGAGSIGSELARQIAKYSPTKLILLDVNENALYFLELELKRACKNLKVIPEICNIRERDKVEYLFSKYRPEIVFHAAAHKHVPLMENNPEEAIKNNLFGTKNLVDTADKYETQRFVLISTDKAVNPTNVMGATKRGCELILEDINKRSNTKFMAVRFGNVLGSNGSVIPHFKTLIEEGKNLTITHPDITRYFMTIPEAAQLVIEAGSLGKGGELFILDMGEPVKIMELAETMIKLSGADIGIDIVGLREGEKLYEELLYNTNEATKTSNKKIFITEITEEHPDVDEYLKKFKEIVKDPKKEEIKSLLKEFIVTYKEPDHHNVVGRK